MDDATLVILLVLAALLLPWLLLWGPRAQGACSERERQAAAKRLERQRREADALGATVEFCQRDIFEPLTGMHAGGYFKRPAGAWTDDTAMALPARDAKRFIIRQIQGKMT